MPETQRMEPRGSWALKILIVVLIVILITSVLYPQKLWREQTKLTDESRVRMDNINAIAQRYNEVTGTWTADLDSLLRFMESDSIVVEQAMFEFDKQSLYDADFDSFLVTFPDRFHFRWTDVEAYGGGGRIGENELKRYTGDSFVLDSAAVASRGLAINVVDTLGGMDSLVVDTLVVDSLVLKMMPKEKFADVVYPVKVYITSNQDLHFVHPRKGKDDISLIVWGDGRFTARTYLPYEERSVPSKHYLLTMPLDSLVTEPITQDTFTLNLNARLTLDGKIEYRMVRRGQPEPAVKGDSLHTNLFVNKLARQARARLEQDMQKDTTLYERQLELQSDYFDVELELMSPSKTVTVESNTEVMVPVDSVSAYDDEQRIRSMLFKIQRDSLIRVWTNLEKTQNIIDLLTYNEQIGLSKVDTVGVTIQPRMGENHRPPSASLLDRIFSVGPVENPGFIENNDLSWSETR
ncbi:MAG: hypothetical protein MAG453_00214 [Calditrichaeota bacterium]|nr:hypothetical protein [Calditrichota bacterium]